MQKTNTAKNKLRKRKQKGVVNNFQLWTLCTIPIIFIFVFNYLPMVGLILAFKKYKYSKGIFGSEWIGLDNFKFLVEQQGFTGDEAALELDRFIDNSVMAGLGTVWIIHGKGTGALKKAVREYLKSNPSVKEFRAGLYGEGEDGVTVVSLK